MRKRRKTAIGLAGLTLILALAGILFHHFVVHKVVQTVAAEYGLEVEFDLKMLSWNRVLLKQLKVNNSEIPEVEVQLEGGSVAGLSATVASLDVDRWLEWVESYQANQEESTGDPTSLSETCHEATAIPFQVKFDRVLYKGKIYPVGIEVEGKPGIVRLKLAALADEYKHAEMFAVKEAKLSSQLKVECSVEGALKWSHETTQLLAKEFQFLGSQQTLQDISMNVRPFSGTIRHPFELLTEVPLSFSLNGLTKGMPYSARASEAKVFVHLLPSETNWVRKARVELNNLELEMEQQLHLEKVAVNLQDFSPTLLTGTGSYALSGVTAKNATEVSLIHPLHLKGRFQLNEKSHTARVRLIQGESNEVLKARIIYKRESGAMELKVPKQTLKLGEAVLVTDLSPAVEEYVKEVSGELTFGGRLELSDRGDQIDLFFSGKGLDAVSDSLKIKGHDFSHRITSFPGLGSPNNQRLFFKEVTMGKSLNDLEILYQVIDRTQVDVRSLSMQFDGANINAKNFSLFPEEKRFANLDSKVEKLKVQTLLRLFYDESVTATGDLSGILNLDMEAGVPVVKSGKLTTHKKGWIQLRPKGSLPPNPKVVPTSPTDILKNYLFDFQYTGIEADLSTDPKFDMKMTMRIQGRNPGYLDGKPLKLSINLDLNVRDMIMSALMTYDIPPALKRKLLKLGK